MNKHIDSNKRSDFNNTLYEIRRLYFKSAHSRDFLSGADKIQVDSEWTKLLQRLNGHGNSAVLNGFKLRLEMDEENKGEDSSKMIVETLFIQCIPNCESYIGYIMIADSRPLQMWLHSLIFTRVRKNQNIAR